MRFFALPLLVLTAFGLTVLVTGGGEAQTAASVANADEAREAYRAALEAQRDAEQRGVRLEAEAAAASETAERTATRSAALAARIQQAEAGVTAAEARLALLAQERSAIRARLAEREEPLVRLTGALQNFARRPVALSVLRPGSLEDVVFVRAVLSSAVPTVQSRTGGLRAELERSQELEREAQQAANALRDSEAQLESQRARLVEVETRQRLASRAASGSADREAERALALAERARDLDSLVDDLEDAGSLRSELAALPGPVIRPQRPSEATVSAIASASATGPGSAPPGLQLPVTGRTLAGFGAIYRRVPSDGIVLSPIGGAQVVAPGAGRVAYSGAYRGYGRIVIIDHGNGWTSLVTGLARTDAAVGDTVVAGAPIGVASPRNPAITLELRRDGEPVNPLEFLG